jgi:hypothetical protein
MNYLLKNEDGFVLVTAMVMLVILTLLGTFALNTTIFELQISGNDRVAKQTFYKADGGIQAGIELLEQNVSCPQGFSSSINSIGGIDIFDQQFAYITEMSGIHDINNLGSPTLDQIPSDNYRAIRILDDPANRVDTAPHTNLTAWGVTKYLSGGGLQMIAGYEGKGKASAGGGAYIDYDLHSQHIGVVNSEAKIATQWRHMIGQEGNCNY